METTKIKKVKNVNIKNIEKFKKNIVYIFVGTLTVLINSTHAPIPTNTKNSKLYIILSFAF